MWAVFQLSFLNLWSLLVALLLIHCKFFQLLLQHFM